MLGSKQFLIMINLWMGACSSYPGLNYSQHETGSKPSSITILVDNKPLSEEEEKQVSTQGIPAAAERPIVMEADSGKPRPIAEKSVAEQVREGTPVDDRGIVLDPTIGGKPLDPVLQEVVRVFDLARLVPSRDLEDITMLEIAAPIEVILVPGAMLAVSATGPKEWVDRLSLQHDSTWLRVVGNLDNLPIANPWPVNVRVEVQMPAVNELRLQEFAKLSIRGILDSRRLEADLSPTSVLSGEVRVDSLEARLEDGSTSQLFGSAEQAFLKMVGHAASMWDGIDVGRLEIDMSDDATGKVRVQDFIWGRAVKNSKLSYMGSPTVQVFTRDQGKVDAISSEE